MSMYLKKSKSLIECFDKCIVQQIPRGENDRADSLSKFGASLSGIKNRSITVMVKDKPTIAEVDVYTVDQPCTWKDELTLYLKEGILPKNPSHAKNLRLKATRFTMIESELYKRTADGPLLKCLNHEQAEYVLKEIHEGSCGNHSGARSLAQKVARQILPNKIDHPFFRYSCHCLGFHPLREVFDCEYDKFLLCLRWGERSHYIDPPLIKRASDLLFASFIKVGFGIPRTIISDNGTQFQGKEIASWLKELKIQQNFTSVGHPQSNGQTELFFLHKSVRNPTDRKLRPCGQQPSTCVRFDGTTNRLMMRRYNKKLRPRELQVGDLVLKKAEVSKHVGKLDPEWEGPFKVVEIRRKGAYLLQDSQGRHLKRPWNIRNLRKFYA
ncbi:UNVERIFIED_CONTAM: hypothetical protein Sindi_0039600 [Sesamum indicum]